jgi:simple sugar transport system ATP-binding protein
MSATPLVELVDIHKAFGAVQALSGASLSVMPGEVIGLVGDNAAGKSTFMKVLTGVHQPDKGEIRINGERVTFADPGQSRKAGIEMIYQNLALAPNLDVVANVFLGRELVRRSPVVPLVKVLDEDLMETKTIELLQRLKINVKSVRLLVEKMSGGQQQAVAIARSVAFQARLVIMDEPTAALAVKEVGKVLDIITNLRADGVSVIIISHRLQDIFNVADRIFVLQTGKTIAERKTKETTMDEIVKFIVGGVQPELSTIASGR